MKRLWFILMLSAVFLQAQDVVILHWNDFHAKNTPYVPVSHNPEKAEVGGYAYLDAYLDSLQAIYPYALRVHAGDDFQGTPVSTITKGRSQIEILNLVKPDFFTIGNHEFDYGWSNIQKLLPLAKYTIYGGNLLDEKSGKPLLPLSKVFEIKGHKIALIGVTTEELYTLTLRDNLTGINVASPVETVKNELARLKKKGVHTFIAVTHIGVDDDVKLAAAVPELDLIIGGHSHTYLANPKVVGHTQIVQAASYGRYIGEVTFNIVDDKVTDFHYELIEVKTAGRTPSADVKAVIDGYESGVAAEMDVQIGILKKDWTRRGQQSNIGQWQAEAMRASMDADFGFQNNGGIRKDLGAGPIYVRDIWEIAPFGNTITTFDIKGSELLTVLQFMLDHKNLMQMSGIELSINKISGKIESVHIGGKILEQDKVYHGVTNNYAASQFDKYFNMIPANIVEHPIVDRDLFIETVKQQKTITGELLPSVEYLE